MNDELSFLYLVTAGWLWLFCFLWRLGLHQFSTAEYSSGLVRLFLYVLVEYSNPFQ